MVKRRFRILGVALLLMAGAAVFAWLSWNHFPEGDGVEYAFVVPQDAAHNDYQPIASLSSVIHSQITHYFTVNGRFLVHCVVQAFCGIFGWKAYAMANGGMLILFTLGLARVAKVSPYSISRMCGLMMLAFVLYIPMRFDPAYQIGYMWTATAIVWWLALWWRSKAKRGWWLLLLGFASLIAGSLHEAFSIVVGFGLLAWWVKCRYRFTPAQLTMSICFATGAFIELLAPGNFLRLDTYKGGPLIGVFSTYFLQLPMLWVYMLIASFAKWKIDFKNNSLYYGGAILGSLAFIIMGITYGYATQGIGLMLAITGGKIWNHIYSNKNKRVRRILTLASLTLMITLAAVRENQERVVREKYRMAYDNYMQSEDGITYINDELFGPEYRSANALVSPYKWVRGHTTGMPAPTPYLLPHRLKQIPLQADTNLIVALSNESWLMIQSRSHPAEFILSRRILGINAGKRTIDFSSSSPDYIYSGEKWRAAVYANEHTPFMKTSIEMK